MEGDGEVVDLKDNNPDSKLEYIKDNVSTEQIFVYDTLYDIYDETWIAGNEIIVKKQEKWGLLNIKGESIVEVEVFSEYKDAGYDEVMSKVARRYLVKRGCKKVIVLATKNIQFYKKS